MLKMSSAAFLFLFLSLLAMAAEEAHGLFPFPRSPFDAILAADHDPFRIVEQTPMTLPKRISDTVALARADWKETRASHVITVDIPGVRREDLKVEVEENRVVRVSGERKEEAEEEGDRWHRAERASGKFWRQFRLPYNADVEGIKAKVEDGVLRITVPKVAEERRRQPKVVEIVEQQGASGQDIKATKAEM